ncbi:MAG: hypothetical protein AAF657_39950, partial [Acidobacteriota bacterium]
MTKAATIGGGGIGGQVAQGQRSHKVPEMFVDQSEFFLRRIVFLFVIGMDCSLGIGTNQNRIGRCAPHIIDNGR